MTFKTDTERQEFKRLTPAVQVLTQFLGLLFPLITGREMVITSVVSGPHSANGLHPKGRAVDIRSQGLPAEAAERFFNILKWTGGLFGGGQVLWEDRGTTNEHFHFGI